MDLEEDIWLSINSQAKNEKKWLSHSKPLDDSSPKKNDEADSVCISQYEAANALEIAVHYA